MTEQLSTATTKLIDAVRWFIVVPIGLLIFPIILTQTILAVVLLLSVLGAFQ